MAKRPKNGARYEVGALTTGNPAQLRAYTVIRSAPRKDGKGVHLGDIGPRFPPENQGKDADEYASELQRETRGYKKGGLVRGDGCCSRGMTKGRMR